MRVWAFCASLLLGCGDHDHPVEPETKETFEPLVAAEDWSAVAREIDPFVSPSPAAPPPECEAPGLQGAAGEQSWVELDTGECSFITAIAGARLAVEEGQKLEITLSYSDLDAPEPGSAELRLRFEECDVWERSLRLPRAADVHVERFDSPCAIAQGGQVLFHLDDEGGNAYQLRGISVLR